MSKLQNNLPAVSRRQAIAILWQKGILTWKLTDVQKELYASYNNIKNKTVVWLCSRRLGKSYALCTIACEQSIKQPNSITKFIAPTQMQMRRIIKPLMQQILEDCPKDLRPRFDRNDNIYYFPNGSEIQLAGTDGGHAESLRGGSSHLCIVDEAGFCDDLSYVVNSILIPTTTTTNGRIILSSTPPPDPNHDFYQYVKAALLTNDIVKKTVYDNKLLSEDQIEKIKIGVGGDKSEAFRREYLCENIKSEDVMVVPEFTADIQLETIKDWQKPSKFDSYVAGDIGSKDLTVFLFAYYDFKNAKLVIEDEIVMNGQKMTTDFLAKSIKLKEKELWTDRYGSFKPPYLRVCDNNLIMINDFYRLHDLQFLPTAKDDAIAALNNMRMMIGQRQVIIHPRCKVLISHLENAVWAPNKKTYAKVPGYGHFDAIDALKYLVRNVQTHKNPYPDMFHIDDKDSWFMPDKVKPDAQKYNSFKNLFRMKKNNRFINK